MERLRWGYAIFHMFMPHFYRIPQQQRHLEELSQSNAVFVSTVVLDFEAKGDDIRGCGCD